MPFVIKRITLNKAELLSVVDKGASGDKDNRPSIVLFKRKKSMPKKETKKVNKADGMGLASLVGAIDELGLSDEQKAGVLQLLEDMKAGPAPAAAPEIESAEKAEDDEGERAEREEVEKTEDAEVTKRHKQETVVLQKRIDALEADAQMVKLNKRADELQFLPASRDETIAILKRVGDSVEAQAMLSKLAKASEESPLLKAAGAVVQGDDSSATATLNKRVKTMQDQNPSMDAATARAAVQKADPELYNQRLAEQRN